MELVAGDPSFDSMPHEFNIENRLGVLCVLKEFHRGTPRTMTRPTALDSLVRGQHFSVPLWSSQGVPQIYIGFYIDSLALLVPVSGIVESVEFWCSSRSIGARRSTARCASTWAACSESWRGTRNARSG